MPDLSDARLDALLRDATMAVPYPAAPSLRTGVVAAIERGRPAERVVARPRPWTRRLALGVAAVVLAFAFGALALPSARTAVAEFFGIVEGQRIEILPTPEVATPASTSVTSTPASTSTAPPTPTATPFALSEVAQLATLDDARAMLGFEPGVPRGAADPEAVYLLEWGRQPLLVLQYEGFDLWQTRGAGFFGKGIPADATLEQPLVAGQAGVDRQRRPRDRVLRSARSRGARIAAHRRSPRSDLGERAECLLPYGDGATARGRPSHRRGAALTSDRGAFVSGTSHALTV